jgi:hypothetical protein
MAINGLKKKAALYNQPELVQFSDQVFEIKPKAGNEIWLWLFLVVLIVLPAAYVVKQAMMPRSEVVVLFATAFTIMNIYHLVSTIRGAQFLQIDLGKKQFVFKPSFKTFAFLRRPVIIDFKKAVSVSLNPKSMSPTNKWLRLEFFDANGLSLNFIDFSKKNEEGSLAQHIKLAITIILKHSQ